MNDNVPSPNRQQVREDKAKLKRKGIKSPKVKEMVFFIHDKRLRATYFFYTSEKYVNRFNELINESPSGNFIISHPELLCTKSIS